MSSEDTTDYQNEDETCAVCGHNATDNGGFTHINHRGNTISLCCSGCVETFSGEPDSYLARLRSAFESGQRNKRFQETPAAR